MDIDLPGWRKMPAPLLTFSPHHTFFTAAPRSGQRGRVVAEWPVAGVRVRRLQRDCLGAVLRPGDRLLWTEAQRRELGAL